MTPSEDNNLRALRPDPPGGETRDRGAARVRLPAARRWAAALLDAGLVAVIAFGIALRFSGMNWNQDTDLHPDEYGLTNTLTQLSVPKSFQDYINTRLSPLSPYQKYDLQGQPTNPGPDNRMRWGQWPITLIRLTAEVTGNTSYRDMRLWGRELSALADTLILLFVFLLGSRLYGRRVGLLATALGSLAVMEIQQSHFMTSDNFASLFAVAAVYFAVRAAQSKARPALLNSGSAWYALFGLAFGLAMASRINLLPLAAEIVVAAAIAHGESLLREREGFWRKTASVGVQLLLAGVVSLGVFRLTQPMAFRASTGDTTLLTVQLNPDWVDSMKVASAESNGIGGGPPGEQWTNRPALIFPWVNMVLWGLGLPLGLAAWLGLGWAAWRCARGKEWKAHLIPVTWAGGYFLFMGTRFVKSIRYFLPIYAFMALFAAWALLELWSRSGTLLARSRAAGARTAGARGGRLLSGLALAVVLGGTLVWAWTFTSIYRTDNTRIQASRWIYQNIPGPINLELITPAGPYTEPLPVPDTARLTAAEPLVIQFTAQATGSVTRIAVAHARSLSLPFGPASLRFVLSTAPEGTPVLGDVVLPVTSTGADPRGDALAGSFGPAALSKGSVYYLRVTAPQGEPLEVAGATVANESWDEGLPLRMDGRDAFGGLYAGLLVENRWPDDAHKRDMYVDTLANADYLFLPSQRGLWTPTRLPHSYPLTVEYYRALFDGRLGFDLVATFSAPLRVGPLYVSDVGGTLAWGHPPALPVYNGSLLAAEEAFSVYDHAPVWIFRKRPDFDLARARAVLEAVDLSQVVPPNPRNPPPTTTNLLLPPDRLSEQRAGGTWSDMFSRDSLVNRFPLLGVLVWWAWAVLTGWAALPLTAWALRGLPDEGYALAKTLGWLLVAWTAWVLGSAQVPFVRTTLAVIWFALAAAAAVAYWLNRERWRERLRRLGRTWLLMEAVFAGLFLFDLLLRWGNGDLWHPAFGGEKPMDFSYLNAVLKSTSFPPYDPWFAGGYINYYYFGFVILAIPIKLLGVVPSFAYNLLLPTLFALLGLGGFGVAWSLATRIREKSGVALSPVVAGLAAAVGLVLLGNLGEVRMAWKGLVGLSNLGVPRDLFFGLINLLHAADGAWRVLIQQASLTYSTGDWYWLPSRAIPVALDASGIPLEVQPITEFPFFTFLYGDPHAHMIAMPLTVLALGVGTSFLLRIQKIAKWRELLPALFVGALAVGALWPTNTWDFPVQLGLALLAVGYAGWSLARKPPPEGARGLTWRTLAALAGLVLLSLLMYLPYNLWYMRGYTSFELWQGSKTPLDSYLVVHGVFLFVIFSYLVWETRDWLRQTPLSSLSKYGPRTALVAIGAPLVILLILVAVLWSAKYEAVALALPLLVWAGLLALRRGQDEARRALHVLVSCGLALTILVEFLVLKGDISRMNTVFKFYLQVWILFAVACGPAVAYLLAVSAGWRPRLRQLWQTALILLVAGGAYYTYKAGISKVQDRMAPDAPRTLDGMDYMAYATYADQGKDLDLKEDYLAIRWMQDNVAGSPVIVEANTVEYHWGSRFTIYTGLPGVVGWNWHQRQQRGVVDPLWVEDRVKQVGSFYSTEDEAAAVEFLRHYDVAYIVVAQLERAYYPQAGLEKFAQLASQGILRRVYAQGATEIYQVVAVGQ